MEINYEDFQKLDIRVGTVISALVPPWSHWVMKLEVDFGKEIGTRTIFAGIMHFYKPKQLLGKQFPFIINIKAKRIGPENELSQGMILAISQKLTKSIEIAGETIDEKPILFKISEPTENGSKVL